MSLTQQPLYFSCTYINPLEQVAFVSLSEKGCLWLTEKDTQPERTQGERPILPVVDTHTPLVEVNQAIISLVNLDSLLAGWQVKR